jgi:8-oxo-dGTP pyrophosphatase MutT (NUDIX family)
MADGAFEVQSGIAWVVYVLLDRETDRALMEYRNREIGYVYPGGNVEAGERPEDTAARECAEEIGVHANLVWYEIGGPEPLMHKGRQGALYVCTDWTGWVPTSTIDGLDRMLGWFDPKMYASIPDWVTGGFQVGRVARRLVDWMGV